eukprot:scaffold723_cov298-Alexandrium_tamarense.AAC.10
MTSSHHDKKKVVVVGSGDKAHGLAHMYECNAHKESYDLVFTEPLQAKKVAPFNTFVSIESFPEALNNADICILAIPSYALETFLIQNFSLLKKDCILVDLTNANKDKKDLKSTIASIGISYDRWVKALNDTGAIQELQHHAGGKSRFATNVCGPNEDCVQEVVELSKVLGYTAKVVPIDQYNHLKITQQTIGWEWTHATAFMVALYALVFTYVIVQASGRPRFEWYTVLGRHLNKTFAFTATWGFAFSLLPGTLMRLIRIVNSSWTPKVLVWGCTIRKHIGLLALYFLFLHACMSVLLFGGEYFGFMFEDGTLEWEAEASMLTAVLSTSLFIITGIASLPSVGHSMNKAQFMFVYGQIVWAALGLGVLHIMFLGVPSWTASPRSPYSWARGMPPITLMASLLPLLVMFIKAVQVCHTFTIHTKSKLFKSTNLQSIHASEHPLNNDEDVKVEVDESEDKKECVLVEESV